MFLNATTVVEHLTIHYEYVYNKIFVLRKTFQHLKVIGTVLQGRGISPTLIVMINIMSTAYAQLHTCFQQLSYTCMCVYKYTAEVFMYTISRF